MDGTPLFYCPLKECKHLKQDNHFKNSAKNFQKTSKTFMKMPKNFQETPMKSQNFT